MKLQWLVAFILIVNMNVMAQTLDYYPAQNPDVSDADYKYGMTILRETYAQIKKNNGDLNYVNYWNLAVAYMTLDVNDPDLIKSFLEKSRSLNRYNFASIFLDSSKGKNIWEGYLTDEEFNSILSESQAVMAQKELWSNQMKTSETEVTTSTPKSKLEMVMAELNENDQKYRKANTLDLEKQKQLDQQNLKRIDSLCNHYGGYIGKSLVGEKYAHVMWSIIQHSNLETMERYLPEIQQAVAKQDLKEGALKMLIDRVYSIKHNYQIFGSQVGVDIAPDDIVENVSEKYQIDTSEKATISKNQEITGNSQLYHPNRKRATNSTSKFPGN